MEATDTLTSSGKNGKSSVVSATSKPKRQRRIRQAPTAYSQQQLKEVSFPLPKVAQQGISFHSLRIYSPFSLTPDGESVCVKKSKSEAVRLSDGYLFDGQNLTVHQLIW